MPPEKTTLVRFGLSDEAMREIDYIATLDDTGPAKIIRTAIKDYLDERRASRSEATEADETAAE